MRLAAYLRDAELSDDAFAELIGVTRQTVHRYKTGDRFPELPVLKRIHEATAGQVTANDFVAASGLHAREPERAA